MSWLVTAPTYREHPYELQSGESFELEASKAIVIPALCQGLIPHDIEIKHSRMGGAIKSQIYLMAAPGLFINKSLLIQSSFLDAGEVVTPVFNMCRRDIRVFKGEKVSMLLVL